VDSKPQERTPSGARATAAALARIVLSWPLAFVAPHWIWVLCVASLAPRPANYLGLVSSALVGAVLGLLARSRLGLAILLLGPVAIAGSSHGLIAPLASISGGVIARALAESRGRARPATTPALDLLEVAALTGALLGGNVVALFLGPAPHFSIYPCRLEGLELTLEKLRATGVPLVCDFHGSLLATGVAVFDDEGLYYFVPRLAELLGITVVRAYDVFLAAIILGSTALALAGVLWTYRSPGARLVAAFVVACVARASFAHGDVHLLPPCAVLALVPIFVAYVETARGHRTFPFVGAAAGLGLGLAHVVRAHAGTPVLAFLTCVLLLGGRVHLRRGLVVLACVGLGLAAAFALFAIPRHARDDYLARNVPGYAPRDVKHPFWHNAYIGLGYLEDNPLGISYRDECGQQRVEALRPGTSYSSPEYERVLRAEVIRVAREDPGFVARTLAAKVLATLLSCVLLARNVGVLALARRRHWPVNVGFAAGIACAALPGLIAIPVGSFLLGCAAFVAVASMTALARLAEDLEEEAPREKVAPRDSPPQTPEHAEEEPAEPPEARHRHRQLERGAEALGDERGLVPHEPLERRVEAEAQVHGLGEVAMGVGDEPRREAQERELLDDREAPAEAPGL
jgi:hypothetical protein